MFSSILMERHEWGDIETFASNKHFIAQHVHMVPDREAPPRLSANDNVTFYVLDGALNIVYFDQFDNKERVVSLTSRTGFKIPSNVQYYVMTGEYQDATFIEVKKDLHK